MFRFVPQFKTLVWGGERIAPLKGVETNQKNIGESWEISAVAGNESVVADGPFKGKTITELCKELKDGLLGKKVYARTGTEFPLLIKFIDAKSDLSIQVHPDDDLAAKRHNSKGKTEMWYVLDCGDNAHLMSGLSQKITKEEYVKMVEEDRITDALCRYRVCEGDVFFIPAGRIHAIGAGCLVAEIQQTSNITYRIYDYGRLGLDGKPRELHTELAKDAIDFSVKDDYRTSYSKGNNKEEVLVDCPYFTTSLYNLDKTFTKDLSQIDSFIVVMCVGGSAELTSCEEQEQSVIIRQGETILLPASSRSLSIKPLGDAKILTSYIR